MDISDGLAGDLGKMLRASGMTAEIADVPFSPAGQEALKAEAGLIAALLAGGDDYEIFAAVPPDKAGGFEQAAAAAQISLHRIGVARQGANPPIFRDAGGRIIPLKSLSYSHF